MKRTVKKNGKVLEYTLICVSGRKNVLLQALPEDKVRLYAPRSARLKEMDELVLSRWDWIENAHENFRAVAKKEAFSPENGVWIEGARVPVEVKRAVKNAVSLTGGVLRVESNSLENAHLEAQIKAFLCRLALERIRAALDLYAPGIGKTYGRVTIREQKTRWGSCSSKGNLNFNWKLILAPKEALTYVVIHELTHLIHFNHSEKFWTEVGKRMPEYDVWRKWLRAHGPDMHI